MTKLTIWRAYGTALAMFLSVSVAAQAGEKDYKFVAVQSETVKPNEATVTVQLIHMPHGMVIKDAAITSAKVTMDPEGTFGGSKTTPNAMPPMKGTVTMLPTNEPGMYRFLTKVTMPGTWKLRLIATTATENEPIRGVVDFEVKK